MTALLSYQLGLRRARGRPGRLHLPRQRGSAQRSGHRAGHVGRGPGAFPLGTVSFTDAPVPCQADATDHLDDRCHLDHLGPVRPRRRRRRWRPPRPSPAEPERTTAYPRPVTIDPDGVHGRLPGCARPRVSDLLADVDDGTAAATAVPGCPEWTVVEVAGHLCGVCVDILEGNLDGVGTAPLGRRPGRSGWRRWAWPACWPAGTRSARRSRPSASSSRPRRPPSWCSTPPPTSTTSGRARLDRRAATRRCLAVPLDFIGTDAGRVRPRQGLADAAHRPRPTAGRHGGDGPAGRRVAGDDLRLFRSFGGRRSLDQIRALDWTGDPEPYLDGVRRQPAACLRPSPSSSSRSPLISSRDDIADG